MQRLEVTYRPEAISDLAEIYRYIALQSGSRTIALAYVQRIRARCQKIGDAPNGGRLRNDLAPGLRIIPFERAAIIAYQVQDTVRIVNIFYGGRDYEALFRNETGDDRLA